MKKLQCQAKGCRSIHLIWKLVPAEKPEDCDMLQEPIGFCCVTHLEKWVDHYLRGNVDVSRPWGLLPKGWGKKTGTDGKSNNWGKTGTKWGGKKN